MSTMKLVLFLLTILLMAAMCQSKNIPEFLKPRKRRAVSVTFMDMYVRSEGCNDPVVAPGTCGTAYIRVHGVDHSLHSRGHNIVTVNAQTGGVIESKAYDTHAVGDAGEKMRDYLNTITGDIVVLVATQDTASNTWLPAKDALMRLGVTEPILMEFRSSFAFIGYAGTNKPSWIAQEQRGVAEGPSIIHLRIALQQSQPEPRMSVFVRSEGCNDPGRTRCGLGFIKVNNQGYSLHSRGMNVVVFSSSGVFLETRGFDTHAWSNAAVSAVNYLNSLSGEKIVLFAVQDEASRFGGPVLPALKRLGARDPLILSHRSSLALVGYAGSYMPSWIGQAQASSGLGPSIVTALIEPVQVLDVHIRSEGCNDPGKTAGTCGIAYIKVNGVDHSLHIRGHNVVTLDAKTGGVLEKKAFDVLADSAAGANMAAYLDTIHGDKIVLIAVQDSTSNRASSAFNALKRLGAKDPILTEFRGSFAFAGYAQPNKPSWITQVQNSIAQGPSEIKIKIPQVEPPYETIGCYKDTSDRAIPLLEGKDPILDGNYGQRTEAIDKCYRVAKQRGFKVFSVQNGGQCASSATAETTFNKHGLSSACQLDGEGGYWANQVYFIKDYKSFGCFKDTGDRAIATIEQTDSILDGAYKSRKHAIAKCAVAALRKGFDMFAVQDGGWCAASSTAENTFDKYGRSSACSSDGKGGAWGNHVYLLGCQGALGMESGAILDSQLSASTEWDNSLTVAQGRLNYIPQAGKGGSWSARTNDANQWFQVDLGQSYTKVTRLAIQGRQDHGQWVTKYRIKYSNDGLNYQDYKEEGQTVIEEFAGSMDQHQVVSHELHPPIWARYTRFQPMTWHGHISMRVEVYGCRQDCQSALGMQSGAILDGQISASSEWDVNHAAIQGRLYYIPPAGKQGAWSAKTNDANQWLQVDLGSHHRVKRVASQGRYAANQWVTKYRIQYSDDGTNFVYYYGEGSSAAKEFAGNTDQDTVIYHPLYPTILTRYVRFRPLTWQGHISMRVEIYGCSQDINECAPAPCQNGGTCVDLVGSYRCDCVAGYSGSNCETNVNECAPAPCQNGGTCVDLVGNYQCDCVDGYSGSNCETNVNECAPAPCQNGATCVDLVGSYQCDCVDGYSGSNCETNVNECAPAPCQNGATCVDLVGSYQCDCVDGYSGSNCETNINDCAPAPCQHGATCVDLVGSYQCDCAAGYTGSNCETNINDCAPAPCKNGAKCVDLVGSYRCDCAPGFFGLTCEEADDECMDS